MSEIGKEATPPKRTRRRLVEGRHKSLTNLMDIEGMPEVSIDTDSESFKAGEQAVKSVGDFLAGMLGRLKGQSFDIEDLLSGPDRFAPPPPPGFGLEEWQVKLNVGADGELHFIPIVLKARGSVGASVTFTFKRTGVQS